ncbi:hypothetical protein GCM10010156_03320 [Planobispora rosea]|uniref:Uncharacterized protein n=1 Tax=Planobispora rosea TaxID=35762 RepID=A0A8J3RVK3_PLARO|nr:hypothetical protein [Planobispora rosea]GGS47894.1 hypothetical protein GCM10010156_03320 [Planobispora rosea]GIH82155.1 hypothetical protein Pro02_05630 [Planobispora rosea]
MGIVDLFQARRLRAGRVLLLGYRPDPALLLETVRLCSPIAHPDRKGIRVTRKMRLRGPIEITPAVEARAGLPAGWRIAYVLEETWRDIGGRYCFPPDVTEGLARRLNGRSHPASNRRDVLASVIECYEIPDRRLAELLSGVLPGLRFHERVDEETIVFRSSASPIRVLFIESRFGTEYEMDVEDPAAITPDLLAAGELAARLIAEETGGIAQDFNGFLLPGQDAVPRRGVRSENGKRLR